MNQNELQQTIEQLRLKINYHNYRYHVLDDPVISDYEFDQLMMRLRQLEADHPELITNDSPTQRSGAGSLERFLKVRHPVSVLSLGNAFNEKDIQAWVDRLIRIDERVESTSFVVEPKIDGLTVVLRYVDGVFTQGATRGDGEVGEDITANLRTIRAMPLRIPVTQQSVKPPSYLVVRGEAYIPLREFEKLNKKLSELGEKMYLNPRNTAAGSLRQLDPSLTASRPLTLFVYSIVAGDEDLPSTQWETLQYLRDLGFPVVDARYCKNITDVIAGHNFWLSQRDRLSFEADGTVIKINDLKLSNDLGVVGKDPRGAIAFKFPAREVTTRLVDVGVNVGRTGVLTPYAVLDPVEIGGVIVKQATLHNFDYISEKDIRIGDMVAVKRAGDVIPYVIGPILAVRTGQEKIYIPPDFCPACGQAVEHLAGEVAWYCVNAACPAQLIRNIEHFVSRRAMDIVGLGIKIVEQLVRSGLVQDISDLYTLGHDELLNLDGFADKKAENLIGAIEASKRQPFSRLLIALGIRGVGEVMAEDLSKYYTDLDQLSKATEEDLQKIEGVGPNIARAIVDWFAQPSNQVVLAKLRSLGVWPSSISVSSLINQKQTLTGVIFVITGTLAGMSREDAKKRIQALGGKVTDSVSKKVDYLVVGENPGSKLDRAKESGVNIINENELYELLNQ
jgi:DNA ligase (NAD+)